MPVTKEIPAQFPKGNTQTPEEPWHRLLTIDLVHRVLGYTIFHPFVAWILVLCFRAQAYPYEHLAMRLSMGWAFVITTISILGLINERIAFGRPREVDLSDEVIVITGGASGLGQLIAEVYGMRNAQIAVLDTKKVDLEEQEEKGICYYECDVGDAQQVEYVAKEIIEDLGTPTILINNAGIVHGKSLLELSAEDVEKTFRTNTLSHFNTIRSFLPGMLDAGYGTIVTVSSVLAHIGAANLADYTASKAALLAMHSSLRAELAQHPQGKDIRTILVTPGQLSTKLFADVRTPSNFLAPVVPPVDVAREVITMVEKGNSGEIAVPLYARWIQVLGILPVGVQRIVRAWSGVDKAMARGLGANRSKDGLEEKLGSQGF